jgi:hypothetical protein
MIIWIKLYTLVLLLLLVFMLMLPLFGDSTIEAIIQIAWSSSIPTWLVPLWLLISFINYQLITNLPCPCSSRLFEFWTASFNYSRSILQEYFFYLFTRVHLYLISLRQRAEHLHKSRWVQLHQFFHCLAQNMYLQLFPALVGPQSRIFLSGSCTLQAISASLRIFWFGLTVVMMIDVLLAVLDMNFGFAFLFS